MVPASLVGGSWAVILVASDGVQDSGLFYAITKRRDVLGLVYAV